MTDIVDRLNARQAFGLNGQRWMMLTAPDADCVEAATEITRLRAALADAEAKLIEREKMCGDCCGYSEADRELLYGVHLESKRKLEEAEAKLVKARDDALEEAAKAAAMKPSSMIGNQMDAYSRGYTAACDLAAAAIRKMKA